MAGVEGKATYDCLCQTCYDEATLEGYDDAHEFFVNHAYKGHNVEIAKAE